MHGFRYILLAALVCAPAFAFDVSGRASIDNYTYLNSGDALFGRAQTELQVRHAFALTPTSSLDLNLEGRAWLLYEYGPLVPGLPIGQQDGTEIAPRNAHVSFTRNDLRIRVGYQVLNWGETFGIPPTDIMNPRDYRNYDFLDSPRNKLSIPLASASYTFADGSVQGFVSPRRNAPRLPKSLGGVAIDDTNLRDGWFQSAEAGARFSYVLSSMNFDITYLFQANRFPVLDQRLAGTAPQLVQTLGNVHTVGLSASKGFEEVVIRADGRYTADHPVGTTLAAPTRTYMDSYSAVVGADWTPTFIDGFTIGAQAQLDRHPVPGVDTQFGANLLLRKSLFRDKLELEGQYFQGLRLSDHFLQTGITVRPAGTWTAKVFLQSFKPDGSSPLRFLGSYDRLGGEVAFSF